MSPIPRLAALLAYLGFLAWSYLYLYPVWLGCGFPLTQKPSLLPAPQQQFPFFQHDPDRRAPFRLLILADPQLEGDTSLPDIQWAFSDLPTGLSAAALQLLKRWRKKLDLWGNDLYLAHIYHSLRKFTTPTHVTVLGDLLGSQWIADGEFERRADRFWNVVFAGGQPVPEFITRQPHTEPLGADPSWKNRVITVVGNHDVGYAGDMTEARVERFERRFGRVNWDIEFEVPSEHRPGQRLNEAGRDFAPETPVIRVQVLNSMNLDTPAYHEGLQTDTYTALNSFIERSRDVDDKKSFTILLTHVPLFKPEGVCTDSPWFDYHPGGNGGGIKEQNLLSDHVSKQLLEGIFGMNDEHSGRNGVILTGHDHEGCDVWHYLPPEDAVDNNLYRWNATRLMQHLRSNMTMGRPGIREVTLRSMMGEYDGNAGFLSAWFDEEEQSWGYAISKCALGPQHYWWAIHVLFLIAALFGAVGVCEYTYTSIKYESESTRAKRAERKASRA